MKKLLPLIAIIGLCVCSSFGAILSDTWTTNATPTGLATLVRQYPLRTDFSTFDGQVFTDTNQPSTGIAGVFGGAQPYFFTHGSATFNAVPTGVFRTEDVPVRIVGAGSSNLLEMSISGTIKAYVDKDGGGHFSALTTSNAFRLDPGETYQDNELVTEARVSHLIQQAFGIQYFFATNANASSAGNSSLWVSQPVSDQWITNSLSAGSNFLGYFFTTNAITGTALPTGVYDSHVHNIWNTGGGASSVTVGADLFIWRTNTAVEVVGGESIALTSQGVELDADHHMTFSGSFPLLAGDLLGVKLYATRTGGASATLRTHFGGTTSAGLSGPSAGGGGTVSDPLSISNVVYQVNNLAVGTSTNVTIDLAAGSMQQKQATNYVLMALSNISAGKNVSVLFYGLSTNVVTAVLPASVQIFSGAMTNTIQTNKNFIVNFSCFGSAASNVVATIGVQP